MTRYEGLVFVGVVLVLVYLGVPSLLWAARRGVLLPAVLALVTRLGFGMAILWIYGLGDNDGSGYHDAAVRMAEGQEVDNVSAGKEAWPVLLSWLYRAFGEAPEVGIAVNAVAAAVAIPVVAVTCSLFGWPRTARTAAWIVALWPVGMLWGGLLLRESIVVLLLAIALLGAAHVRAGSTPLGIGLMIAAGLLLTGFRGGLGVLPLAVMPATLGLVAILGARVRFTRRAVMVTVVLLVVAVSVPLLADFVNEARYFDWESVANSARANTTGSTSAARAGGSLGEFGGIPRGVVNLPLTAFGPPIWGWSTWGLVSAGIDGVLWLGMTVLAVLGIRSTVSKANAALCWVPLVLLLVYLGIGLSNYGLLMRIRAVGIPFLAPLAALGIVYLVDRRRKKREGQQQRDEDRGAALRLRTVGAGP